MQKGEPANRLPLSISLGREHEPGNGSPAGFERPAGLFGGQCRVDRNKHLRVRAGAERHIAVDQGVDGVILAQTNAGAGVPLGAALTDDDVAGNDNFATELLDAETTASRITTVAG